MAHFIGFPYLSKGFLPCFEYGLFVIFCLAILQFVFFDCCSVDVHCKYLGLWNGIFVFCVTWFLCFCWTRYRYNNLYHIGILWGILGSDNRSLPHYSKCIWVSDRLDGFVLEKLVLVLYLSVRKNLYGFGFNDATF